MGYIYKITNKINGKVYIGQTVNSIEQRFIEHKSHCKNKYENKPLHNAFRKYGFNNFIIEEIEKVDNSILNEREKYWIQFYDSYNKGYNATLGGDGIIIYDYEKIKQLYLKNYNQSEVARILGCDYTTVARALKSLNVKLSNPIATKNSKAVKMIQEKKEIYYFNKIADASKFLIQNNYTKNKSVSSVSTKIKMVCDNKRKTAYGFRWKYA